MINKFISSWHVLGLRKLQLNFICHFSAACTSVSSLMLCLVWGIHVLIPILCIWRMRWWWMNLFHSSNQTRILTRSEMTMDHLIFQTKQSLKDAGLLKILETQNTAWDVHTFTKFQNCILHCFPLFLQNENRLLWKLGTLPPGLLTFYKLTHPLDKSWHVLGLGYNPTIERSEIDNAAVIHYNGNMKPWLEIAMTKYRPYWTKYINYEHPYIHGCKISQ